jgi:hypothetical protein
MSIIALLTGRKRVGASSNYADSETCRPGWKGRFLLWLARCSARSRERQALVQLDHEALKAVIHAPCLPDQLPCIALQPNWKHLRIWRVPVEISSVLHKLLSFPNNGHSRPLHMSSCKEIAEDPGLGTPLRENPQSLPEKPLAEERPTEPEDNSTYDHPCSEHGGGALQNRKRWLSCHRTSQGIAVYYRCSCGRSAVALLNLDCSLLRAGHQTGGTESARRFAAPVVGGG